MSTIQKRSNNTYTITVSLGYGADGKQIRRTKTIEADSKLKISQRELKKKHTCEKQVCFFVKKCKAIRLTEIVSQKRDIEKA